MKVCFPDRALSNLPLMAGVFLLMLCIVAYVSYDAGKNDLEEFVAEYPLIDPARHFIEQKYFATSIHPLRQEVSDLTQAFDGDISIYIEDLNTGANISINHTTNIFPASLAKLPIAMIVMKKVEEGTWTLSNELVLMQSDQDARSGAETGRLSGYPVGTRFTIERLLQELLVNSDNTAYSMFLRNLGENDFDNMIDAVGLDALFSSDGKISAKEYSRMLRALYTSSFLSQEYSQMILTWLDEAPFDHFLASAIPKEIPFAHKYGQKTDQRIFSDAGIVYLPKHPYLITVMLQLDREMSPGDADAMARAFMASVSGAAYNYFSAVGQ